MSIKNTTPKKSYLTSLIGSAISVAVLSTASTPTLANTQSQEKCAGIVKGGLNDCASAEHVCAGMNTDDAYPTDWIWLPQGTCNKINNAHVIIEEKAPKAIEKVAKLESPKMMHKTKTDRIVSALRAIK